MQALLMTMMMLASIDDADDEHDVDDDQDVGVGPSH